MTRLLSCIQDRGLSYGELAARTGLSKSSIQRWATGDVKTIPADSAAALGTVLGVSGAYLLGLEEPRPCITLRIPATKGRHDEARLTGVVRISPEAELALLALSGKTGLSLKYIASELIVQAAQMCDIEHA